MNASRVERGETEVMFVRAAGGIAGVRDAWQQLESRVGSLKGRRFLGAYEPVSNEYRACVERRDEDDPAALGLETDVLAGGPYLRSRLHGEPPAVYDEIGPAFEQMAKEATPDPTRPSLEVYRRHDDIEVLLPVK